MIGITGTKCVQSCLEGWQGFLTNSREKECLSECARKCARTGSCILVTQINIDAGESGIVGNLGILQCD